MYTKAQVSSSISTVLHDTATAIYSTAEIDMGINDGLIEIATFKPYVVLATATPPAGTPDLDISGISDLIHGYSEQSFDAVEFQVDKRPKRFRNFTVKHSTLTMDISFSPDGTDAARLFCYKPHILGGSGTTSLTPETQRLLIDLVSARLSINQGMKLINQYDTAIAAVGTVITTIGSVDAQITLATALLASAATQTDLTPALILQAATAIESATAQVATATANLISGTAFIDLVTAGDDPEADWLRYSGGRLGVANTYFGEGSGYLNLATADEAGARSYSEIAARRLTVGQAVLNKSVGYLRSISSRMAIAQGSNLYQSWGERKLANTLINLQGLVENKAVERWPVVL